MMKELTFEMELAVEKVITLARLIDSGCNDCAETMEWVMLMEQVRSMGDVFFGTDK